MLAVNDDKRRSLLYAIGQCKVNIFFCHDLLAVKACLVQIAVHYAAVGAVFACKEDLALAGRVFAELLLNGRLLLGLCLGVQGTLVLKDGGSDVILLALLILLSFACVPVLHRTVVAGYTAVNFGALTALGTDKLLAGEVAVIFAYGVGRTYGVVRQLVILGYLADKVCGCFPIGQLLAEECVEYSAGCVKRLELVLNIEG